MKPGEGKQKEEEKEEEERGRNQHAGTAPLTDRALCAKCVWHFTGRGYSPPFRNKEMRNWGSREGN